MSLPEYAAARTVTFYVDVRSEVSDGQPHWTEDDCSIQDTEFMLWYVFSHMHVPRPEDWPVMPACSIGFHLKPDGFFNQNPALDLPPSV